MKITVVFIHYTLSRVRSILGSRYSRDTASNGRNTVPGTAAYSGQHAALITAPKQAQCPASGVLALLETAPQQSERVPFHTARSTQHPGHTVPRPGIAKNAKNERRRIYFSLTPRRRRHQRADVKPGGHSHTHAHVCVCGETHAHAHVYA